MDKEKFNKAIGEAIRDVRIEKGMTQEDVATLMGIEKQNLSKYERGLISPTFYWLVNFCEAVKINNVEFVKMFWNKF